MYKVVSKKDYHGVRIVNTETRKTVVTHDSFRKKVKEMGKERAVGSFFRKNPKVPKRVLVNFVMRIILLRRERALMRMLRGKKDNKGHLDERLLWNGIWKVIRKS
jgi:hypothetical protein